jgi:RNA polymerase sigma-70 factor (ECF subfamily)
MARETADDLVAAARAGDEDAWRELYLLHSRRLTVWLASLPRGDSASSPEDIAAQAWLTAASKIADFKGTRDDFAGWLFTIARHHASNAHRTAVRRGTDPVAVEPGVDTPFGAVVDDLAAIDAQDSTRALLATLTPRQAQVVACIDVVGLDVSATAAALDMSATAVRVTRHRALNRLRAVLAERDAAPDVTLVPLSDMLSDT